MAPPPLTLRCPRCGRYLVAPAPPFQAAAWFGCPHCGAPVPVVAPRDPPPLFTWEVFPHLYPTVIAHRPLGRGAVRSIFALLLSAAAILSALAVALIGVGAATLAPGTFPVEGSVLYSPTGPGPGAVPVLGATINLTGEHHQSLSGVSGPDGRFRFANVQPGGITLNVSAPGYVPAVVDVFVSATYSTLGRGAGGLIIYLARSAGPSNVTSTNVPAPAFSDLETFVANDLSTAILLGLAAVVAGAGAWAARTDSDLALGTAGGSAAAIAPVMLYYLGIATAFPIAAWLGALTVGLGAAAAGLQAARMAAHGHAPEPE